MESTSLVEVYRGKLLESEHKGDIAVVDSAGTLLYYAGNPNKIVYARSSMKPIQAIPVIETGAADHFGFSDADISLCCASHSGEKQHTDRVLEILGRVGLEDSALQCGVHIPHWQETYKELIRNGQELTPLFNNCSGKHTGMLATAKHMGETLENYYDLDHPVQQRILDAVSEMTDTPRDDIKIGIDGCGVPVHGVPLEKLAYSFARMANPASLDPERQRTVKRITQAMTAAPEMVGGTNRFCTDLMIAGQGRFFGKAGAEAVYCIGDNETGLGIAIKIEDGNGRAMYPAAVEVLKQLDLLSESQLIQLNDHYLPTLKNARQEEIGRIVSNFSLVSTAVLS